MSLETLKFCKTSVMVAISVLKRALNGILFFEIKNWPRCNKTCGLLQNVALFSLENIVFKCLSIFRITSVESIVKVNNH